MNEKVLEKSVAYIKDWLRFRYERDEMPGYVAAVSYKGKIILNEAYGYANLETKEKMTPDHIFRIASHSKTFTATAIMQLQEQGKLRIDDYVADYLAWLGVHPDPRWHKVTIRQLLSHGAGVIRDGEDGSYWSLNRPFPSEAQLQTELSSADLILDNNTAMKYSNYGYSLLGLVIQAVSGVAFNTYVVDNIIKPLHLKNTGPEYSDNISSPFVTGYTRRDYQKKRLPIAHIDTKGMSAATGFYSTTEDMCAYFHSHIVGTETILGNESKKEMQRTQWQAKRTGFKEDYGLGFEIDYIGERRTFGHGGGFPGQITKTLCDPEDQLIVIVLSNGIDSWSGYIAKNILKVIDYFQSNSTKTAKHDMKRFEGRFIALWSILDLVAMGDKMVTAYPNSWEPFEAANELSYIDDKTLKITKTDSFSSEGELVYFTYNSDGSIKSLTYAGDGTFMPEADYLKSVSEKKSIRVE